jgi:transposase
MPQPYPKEFRDDVVRVVQTRDSKTTIAQIAKDFGVHEGTIAKWLRQADIDALFGSLVVNQSKGVNQ